ncbi:MAG: S1-C subfamily serine protease [Pirellulaceae bacterium]|jgi:S1-C subfamily serine protease
MRQLNFTSKFALLLLGCLTMMSAAPFASAADDRAKRNSFAETVNSVQPKMVKVYGAGGLKGLEAYQSGFLISADGHVLTSWSYVLDTDYITITLNDGRKFEGTLVGADPRLEIAVVKIEATDLPFFDLSKAAELESGDRVLAFSNLYGVATGNEPASVLHGSVSAKTTLAARRGAFQSPYKGPVYVVDAMTNNPGATGGALTNRRGELAGILGKELRNSQNNTWLNYSVPVSSIREAVEDILAGRTRPRSEDENARKPADPVNLSLLGIVLVPDVLAKTPPFVDRIVPDSPAQTAGIKVDDLVLFVNNRIVSSVRSLRDELSFIDRLEIVRLTIQRKQELIDVELRAK